MNNFALEILSVVEKTAISVFPWIGKGNKLEADKIAVQTMRSELNKIDNFGAKVILCEGKKDESYQLEHGEIVGKGDVGYDIVADCLEGTTQTAKAGYGAMSVVLVGPKQTLFGSDVFYMKKLSYGKKIKSIIKKLEIANNIRLNLHTDLTAFLYYLNTKLDSKNLTVCILDRERNLEFIEIFRKKGWKVKLIQDGDVSGVILSGINNSGIDLYYGIGGTTEGILSAGAMKCLDGHFEGILYENGKLYDNNILTTKDLIKEEVMFVASGITDGPFLKGIKSFNKIYKTNSILIQSFPKMFYKIESEVCK